MKKNVTAVFFFCCLLMAVYGQVDKRSRKTPQPQKSAQQPAGKVKEEKKYPSLLWEITGNGLKQPSYLFGTMHVSDKLAFHLGDSFYNAIKSVEMVALETNPEHWQDDYSRSIFYRMPQRARGRMGVGSLFGSAGDFSSDYMQITTFAIDTYEEKIKAALAVEPSMINGMLYRSYDGPQGDFEEDTYLDMYIFQVGRKLGKKLNGVEDFRDSEKLVMEAYRDMYRDQQKKRRSYDYEALMSNPKKVEDAYRRGDLDLLDSLQNLAVFSEAFQEKFLFKRNEIQAHSIDTILRKHSLFVGVGAAHLPGPRGVIEILREKGYTLRPVKMDDRNSEQKEMIEKIFVDKPFKLQTADDGFFKVAIPGDKFYRFTEWNGMDMVQFADMVNGAYYMVTRIKTNSYLLGHSSDVVYRKIDSLLYENVPGKILKRATVTRNGYKGFDFTNRTRRGDHQRYQVFVTPFEIIVFKISGIGDYINVTKAADQFFGSIELTAYPAGAWQQWQPALGGFTAEWPHTPVTIRDNSIGTDRLEYAARDPQDGNSYLVMQASLHNYEFIEADTFELSLMEESYSSSSCIEKLLERRFSRQNGYPALDCRYRHKDGSFSTVKFIIRGPVYYVVVARYKKQNENVKRFISSFSITPYRYLKPAKTYTDTTMCFTVKSPVVPVKKEGEDMIMELENLFGSDEDSVSRGIRQQFKTETIGNDTTGEKIFIVWIQSGKYDSVKPGIHAHKMAMADSTYIYLADSSYMLPNGIRVREVRYTDTGSSRMIMKKGFSKNGRNLTICTLTDTGAVKSSFITSFFTSFQPFFPSDDNQLATQEQLFDDLFSEDSLVAKAARRYLGYYNIDSSDIPFVKRTIERLRWGMPDYLDRKANLIAELGRSQDSSITLWLRDMYWEAKDTAALQSAVLNALLGQRTLASFIAFRDLIVQEPPILEGELDNYRGYSGPSVYDFVRVAPGKMLSSFFPDMAYRDRGFWYPLYDTLALTKQLLPGFLQLMLVDDFEDEVLDLLAVLVDSGYCKADDYGQYFSKIYIDGKQLLKKQRAKEDKAKLEKAAKKDSDEDNYASRYLRGSRPDQGNKKLDKYAILLLPFRDKNPGVQQFFEQLLQTQDDRLLYNTNMLLLRHGHQVHDSIFTKYASRDEYRWELYHDLKEMNKLDKFPRRYKNQMDIVRSMLVRQFRDEKLDTLAFVDKLPVTYQGKKGVVYFFKYKRMRDDAVWQIASVGMQPEKPDEIDIENYEFTSSEENDLKNDKPVKQQLHEALKEMLYSKRKSASMFYQARMYNYYKNYLSEMVKQQRYKD
jgi:Uncharacterized protein conserved in bacteria